MCKTSGPACQVKTSGIHLDVSRSQTEHTRPCCLSRLSELTGTIPANAFFPMLVPASNRSVDDDESSNSRRREGSNGSSSYMLISLHRHQLYQNADTRHVPGVCVALCCQLPDPQLPVHEAAECMPVRVKGHLFAALITHPPSTAVTALRLIAKPTYHR